MLPIVASLLASLALSAGAGGEALRARGRDEFAAAPRLARVDRVAPAAASRAAAESGREAAVHLVLVIEGADVALDGIAVRAGTSSAVTGREGGAYLAVEPGTHRLVLELPAGRLFAAEDGDARAPARSIELPELEVVPGETSELIVTLSRTGELLQVLDEVAGKAHVDGEGAPGAEIVAQGPPGKLSGQVVSLEDGKPIQGARVFVRGAAFEIETDKQGRFALELPSGTHALSIIHTRFSTRTLDGVEVPPGGEATVLVELSPAAVELEELVVTAPHVEGTVASVVDERRETTEVAEILGAEQMSKAGDSTAAAALTRVTGVTLVGGRFVYVRGLGERYSSTLLNGADLPSPDPSRRIIPLDLFPTGVLGSVVVQKTYSPDMPGDFSGGVVQLRTRGVPETFKFSLGLSTGGNSITTFQDGNTHRGGSHDWLGYDDGTRAIPREMWELTKGGTVSQTQPGVPRLQKIPDAVKAGWFRHDYETQVITTPPNFGLNLDVGDRFKLGPDVKLGYQVGAQYDNAWRFRPERRIQITQDTVAGGFRADFPADIRQSTQEVNLASIAAVSAELGSDHLIELTGLGTRKTAKNTSVDFVAAADTATRRESTLSWNEQELFALQLRGEHKFERLSRLKLDWMVNRASSARDEPDTREYRFVREPPSAEMPDPPFRYGGATASPLLRSYETLADQAWVYGVNAKLPVTLGADSEVVLSGGVLRSSIDRDARVLRWAFATQTLSNEQRERGINGIFAEDIINDNQVRLQDKATDSDAYTAILRVTGVYLAAEYAFRRWLRVQGGARVERAEIRATTRPLYVDAQGTDVSVTGGFERTDLLPAATATLTTSEDTQVRLAVSNTVNRPQLRELSTAVFIDPETRIPFRGDSSLKPADIMNYDARFEWYPSKTESVSAAVFAKTFDDPIEVKTFASDVEPVRIFFNSENAKVYGVEFDARHELDRWHDDLDGFYLAGNLSLIQSEVTIRQEDAAALTSLRRPMQGQSPWIVNLQLGYTEPERGRLDTMVSFSVFGPRLMEAGTRPIPDAYEQPMAMLDVTASYRFSERLRLKLKGRNLLNPRYRLLVGGLERRQYELGRSVSLALSYDF